MAAIALTNLIGAVLLAVALLALGRFEMQTGAVLFLTAFGWLTGLGLAKLYKIVAFLTWLDCYGPVLGKTVTPRVQDLVIEERAAKWFWLFFTGVWSATACLLLDTTAGFRMSAALMLAGTIGIAAQLVRTRLMTDLTAEFRQSHVTRRPPLFASQQTH